MPIKDNLNEYIEQQIFKDLDVRSLNGSYIYLAAWLLIGGGTGFYQQHLIIYLVFGALFLMLGVTRVVTYRYFSNSPRRNQSIRKKWIYFNALAPALLYSLLLSLAFYSQEFKGLFLYILMTVFALLSAGTVNFAPDKKLSLIYVITLSLLPFIVAVFFTQDSLIEGLMMPPYALYMGILAIRLNKEYLQLIEQQYVLSRLNLTDSLTGIGNRRQFDETVDTLWKSSLRAKSCFCLLIIDIDYFKRVNDNHGHATGDHVIKRIAEIIQSICKRDSDVVTRIGGEEFAVLFNNDDQQKVESLAETIRSTIEQTELSFDNATTRVTVSIGVAMTIPSANNTALEFFKTADKCLYSAKAAGRNNVLLNWL